MLDAYLVLTIGVHRHPSSTPTCLIMTIMIVTRKNNNEDGQNSALALWLYLIKRRVSYSRSPNLISPGEMPILYDIITMPVVTNTFSSVNGTQHMSNGHRREVRLIAIDDIVYLY